MSDGVVQLVDYAGGNGEETKKILVISKEDQIDGQDLQLLTTRIKDKGMSAKRSRIRQTFAGDWQDA